MSVDNLCRHFKNDSSLSIFLRTKIWLTRNEDMRFEFRFHTLLFIFNFFFFSHSFFTIGSKMRFWFIPSIAFFLGGKILRKCHNFFSLRWTQWNLTSEARVSSSSCTFEVSWRLLPVKNWGFLLSFNLLNFFNFQEILMFFFHWHNFRCSIHSSNWMTKP